jgi:hypothetical protein
LFKPTWYRFSILLNIILERCRELFQNSIELLIFHFNLLLIFVLKVRCYSIFHTYTHLLFYFFFGWNYTIFLCLTILFHFFFILNRFEPFCIHSFIDFSQLELFICWNDFINKYFTKSTLLFIVFKLKKSIVCASLLRYCFKRQNRIFNQLPEKLV